jgi:transposase
MPYHYIPRAVKISAMQLWERELLPLNTILDVTEMSRSTFFRILKLWRDTGDVISHKSSLRGRLRVLNYDDMQHLQVLIEQNPDYFLDELLHLLETNRFISAHYTTIHRALEQAGVSRKKLKKIAYERSEPLRADFIGRMARYDPEELGFLDEVHKDERTLNRGFGRAKKGRRAARRTKFVRGRRTSTEALLSLNGIVACKSVEGSMTKELFLEWLEFNVVSITVFSDVALLIVCRMQLPKCTAYPGPLSVLVMDNAKIHHGPEISELCAEYGPSHLHIFGNFILIHLIQVFE